ncbi:MgtC/SapB family protein [Halorientalis brevis]|uniref:MgtC/SapB family protein n=1 Tax=Halorientalis brevis TaxID=1126241 RepID=A0ABD6CBG7_9EURY|nr:MgtC/SapB family protein [Halorientalis brevis]
MFESLSGSTLSLVVRLLVALGIGGLVGMEREQSESAGTFAGSRTFPLFGLYGAVVQAFFPDLLPVALAVLAVPLTVAYVAKIATVGDVGLTTVMAALVTTLLGALTMHSEQGLLVAVVVGGVMTVLLSAKDPIHAVADRIDERERRAVAKLILVTLVVLPVLPNRELAVIGGLNPQFVWLMVVFVSGLGFVAYLLTLAIGTERGIILTGVLGGFVSSTATTVSMAERTAENPSLYRVAGVAAVIAATVMFPRALVEVAVVNPALLPHAAVPMLVMTVVAAVATVALYWYSDESEAIDTEMTNPFRLRSALFFGALFAAVLLVSEYANAWFGSRGIYVTAFLSGLADVDAMTLSLSKLAAEGSVSPDVATTGIVIAAIANTLVKAGLTWVLGTRRLGRRVTAVLGVAALAGLVVVMV